MNLKFVTKIIGLGAKASAALLAPMITVQLAHAEDCAIVFSASTPPDIPADQRQSFLSLKNDAVAVELMSQMFKKAGYSTVYRLGGPKATKQNLSAAFAECKQRVKQGDRFTFYLCAHGSQMPVYFKAILGSPDQWLSEDINGIGSGWTKFSQNRENAVNEVSKGSGKKPGSWTDTEMHEFVKRVKTEDNARYLRQTLDSVITDSNIRSWVEELNSDKCTVLLESCHSGGATKRFVEERSMDTQTKCNYGLPNRNWPLNPMPLTSTLADLIGGSGTRAMASDTVVLTSVQGEEAAAALPFARSDFEGLGFGNNWLPAGDQFMVGVFTYLFAKDWYLHKFGPIKWRVAMGELTGALEHYSKVLKLEDDAKKPYIQQPQMDARHEEKNVLFFDGYQSGATKPPVTPSSNPKAPVAPNHKPTPPPAAPPSAQGQDSEVPKSSGSPSPNGRTALRNASAKFDNSYMRYHCPDKQALKLSIAPNFGRIATGTGVKFKLDLGTEGYLFIIDEDSSGAVQLLPWSTVEVGTSPEQLVEQAQCSSGTDLNVGGSRFTFRAGDAGHEHVKALLFLDEREALEFVKSWSSLNPKTASESRSLSSRSLVVVDNGQPRIFTADLEFEVVRG